MTRAALVGLALLAASPAEAACHHFSYWAYLTPQPRCGGLPARTVARAPPQVKAAPDLPLPVLSDIVWAPPADDATVGLVRLRAALDREDK